MHKFKENIELNEADSMYPKKKMNYLAHPHSHTYFMLNSPLIPNKIGILPIWSKGIRFSSLPWRSGCWVQVTLYHLEPYDFQWKIGP